MNFYNWFQRQKAQPDRRKQKPKARRIALYDSDEEVLPFSQSRQPSPTHDSVEFDDDDDDDFRYFITPASRKPPAAVNDNDDSENEFVGEGTSAMAMCQVEYEKPKPAKKPAKTSQPKQVSISDNY